MRAKLGIHDRNSIALPHAELRLQVSRENSATADPPLRRSKSARRIGMQGFLCMDRHRPFEHLHDGKRTHRG